MKKFVTIIAILTITFIWYTHAYLEDKVFCTISKNAITVTIEREKNYKCNEYLSVLSKSINTEYQNVLSIQALIEQWYDVDFWKEIRETKRAQIKKMLSIKEQIETAVKEFDTNMFLKIKDYLVYSTATDRTNFKKTLKHLENIEKNGWHHSSSVKKKISYMQDAITAIDTINSTNDFDTLMKNFNKYIYLKNQIVWK
jgi:hypothetical protein